MSYSVEGGKNLDGIFIFVPFSNIQTKKMSRVPQNKRTRLILLKQFFMKNGSFIDYYDFTD